ncbi:uncharacterized protein [Onthophagus taurus]|uniref:uncharacterized protein n=1 Tax=Onthophagus taurus TaxID=166361 RepID=UPI0039BE7FCA
MEAISFILLLVISMACGNHHVSEYSSSISNEDVNDAAIEEIERYIRKIRYTQTDYGNIKMNQNMSENSTELKNEETTHSRHLLISDLFPEDINSTIPLMVPYNDSEKIAEATLTPATWDHTNVQINPSLPDAHAEESYPVNQIGEIPILPAHGLSDPVPIIRLTFGRFNINYTDNKMNTTEPVIDNNMLKQEINTNNSESLSQPQILFDLIDNTNDSLEQTPKNTKSFNIVIRFKRSLKSKRHRWSSILINGDYSTPQPCQNCRSTVTSKSTSVNLPITTTESITKQVPKDYNVQVNSVTKNDEAQKDLPLSTIIAPTYRPCLTCRPRTTSKPVYTPKGRNGKGRGYYYK